ncbi:hypothetical protein Taro_038818 [Colocasia esculenta]|uniref:Uncharacterized protein n=1 Tax=Colocasia esculenta TaxID=4460 RepID=A0A843W930_COLES|nr:hypothetical protein [Colocasia esculenta]
MVVVAWPCLASVGIVGLALLARASGGFRSVSSRFRSPALGRQSVVAPARVASRPYGLFPIFGVPTALAGEGLVIPTGPSSRGSPPYFLQLGARRRESSVSDGLRRWLVAPCVVSSSESECCELLYSNPWVATRTLGSLAGVREVRSLQLVSERGSTEICKEVITIAVPKQGVWLPCRIRVHATVGCSCCCVACVVSVVARCVRVVVVRLALDSLAVIFPVWTTVVGKSRCGAPGRLWQIWVCVPLCLREPACGVAFTGAGLLPMELVEEPFGVVLVRVSLRTVPYSFLSVDVLPQGLRYVVVLAGAFWRVFPERCLGGSSGGSPRNGLHCFCSL